MRDDAPHDSEQPEGSSQPRQRTLKSPRIQECLLQWVCARESEQAQSELGKLGFVSERNLEAGLWLGTWLTSVRPDKALEWQDISSRQQQRDVVEVL